MAEIGPRVVARSRQMREKKGRMMLSWIAGGAVGSEGVAGWSYCWHEEGERGWPRSVREREGRKMRRKKKRWREKRGEKREKRKEKREKRKKEKKRKIMNKIDFSKLYIMCRVIV